VIETAKVVHDLLESLGISSFPKTSGSTGLHIYIPLGAKYNYEQSRQLAELIATLVHQELPSFTSLVRDPEKRKDKIYIDYLQNRPIQTICSPYSVRPKPGATVSAPLNWVEVKPGLKMQQFTIHGMLDRVKSEGDLFEGVLKNGIDLNTVLRSLTALV
jgi:bifunctional non-homologous end joining protein LigD